MLRTNSNKLDKMSTKVKIDRTKFSLLVNEKKTRLFLFLKGF